MLHPTRWNHGHACCTAGRHSAPAPNQSTFDSLFSHSREHDHPAATRNTGTRIAPADTKRSETPTVTPRKVTFLVCETKISLIFFLLLLLLLLFFLFDHYGFLFGHTLGQGCIHGFSAPFCVSFFPCAVDRKVPMLPPACHDLQFIALRDP